MSPTIPTGWSVSNIGDLLLEARSGFACGEDLDEGVIQFRMNNVTKEGLIDWSKIRRVPPDSKNILDFQVTPGDLLFNHTNSPDLVGKCAIFPGHQEMVTFSNHFLRLRPDPKKVVSGYLHRWVSALWAQGKFKGMCKQWVNQATVSKDQVLGLRLPVPPLQEQHRIAAILDHAEALRTKRRAALAKLDTLAQGIFIEMFGDPSSNPKGWPTKALREIASTTSGGTPDRSIQAYFEGSIPWVKSGEIHQGVVTHTSECISEAALADSAAKLLPVGTVLVAMYGATVGAVGVLGIKAATNQAICCITLGQSVASDYFVNLMKGSTTSLLAKRVGGAQPNLSQDLIRNLRIPTPPLELQMRFAEIQKALVAVRGNQEHSLDRLDGLFSSLQHRAFQGEL